VQNPSFLTTTMPKRQTKAQAESRERHIQSLMKQDWHDDTRLTRDQAEKLLDEKTLVLADEPLFRHEIHHY
jgi:hypothetical protein